MSVTTPQGFSAAGVACGLKSSGDPDLALVRNHGPRYHAAAVFTANRVKAAPVLWSQQVLADRSLKAVVLNSGGANACTGPDGFADTHRTAEAVAAALTGAGEETGAIDVAVCSTGIIGQRLPIEQIIEAIPALTGSAVTDGGSAAARAIMTTDTVAKEAVARGEGWSIGAMGKGAAMLAPGLATMLVVITTDADIPATQLQSALAEACRLTFDRIDSDGCMSTNDTVLIMSSGAGAPADPIDFTEALTAVCDDLAGQMIADAEGASHEVVITVTGAESEEAALTAARAVARNNLVKCAIYGNDPYWGRVLAAIGAADVDFDPDRAAVSFNGVQLCRDGYAVPGASVDISARRVDILVDLQRGVGDASLRTTDLTHEYVRLNTEYPT